MIVRKLTLLFQLSMISIFHSITENVEFVMENEFIITQL